jgi:hypothetical protein
MTQSETSKMSDEIRNDEPLTEPERLLAMFTVGSGVDASTWLPSELGAILAHELDTPIREALDESSSAELKAEWAGADATVRKLLAHPTPPPSLLERLKEIAKASSVVDDGPLPKEVATVLYIAAIVAGLRAGQKLSGLDDESLRQRVEWACRRRWIDPQLREQLSGFTSSSR